MCRRRDGLADTIKVAGIGLVHVALVNERRNHLAGHRRKKSARRGHSDTAMMSTKRDNPQSVTIFGFSATF